MAVIDGRGIGQRQDLVDGKEIELSVGDIVGPVAEPLLVLPDVCATPSATATSANWPEVNDNGLCDAL